MYTEGIDVTKCTASWEPSDVSLQSNKELKIVGDHFMPPPYQTRVKGKFGWVTRSTKARFGQVGDQVSQVKVQVGQGQGQELDNNVIFRHSMIIWVRSFLLQIILLGCSSYIFFGSMMTQICIQ